ncbi:hypothetical protein PRIC1_011736 [Phytophthora ramorum]
MATPTPTRKQHSQIKGAVPYSTDLQRRKRREARGLRSEENELRAQLAELRSARQEHVRNAAALATQPGTMNQWRSRAVLENEKRARAEHINRELKDILEPQMQIRSAICKTLAKTGTFEGMSFVVGLHPLVDKLHSKVYRPVPGLSVSQVALDEITNSLDWLRLDTDSMFPVVEGDTVVSFRCQSLPQRGSVQMSSITPAGCSAQELGDVLWRHATNPKRASGKCFHCISRKTPSPLDLNATASLLEGALCVSAVSSFRRYDEGDRIILVGTTKWFLPDGRLLLQDYHWTVISASPSNPLNACVMRTCYQLRMASPLSGDAAHAQQMVYNSINGKMRNFYQLMQDNLLSGVECRL